MLHVRQVDDGCETSMLVKTTYLLSVYWQAKAVATPATLSADTAVDRAATYAC